MRSVERSYGLVEDLVSREEFDRELHETIEGSGRLFTEELAAALVVERLGRSRVRVPSLDKARASVTTVVRGFIARVTSVREFERDGRAQKVANVLLKDGTGQLRLVLWDDHAALADGGALPPGSWIRAANVTVKGSGEGIEAHAGRSSTVYIEDESLELEEEERTIFDVEWTPISDLREGDFVSVRGDIVAKRGARTFRRRDGSQGRVLNLTVFDGRAMAILVLWDDLAERFSDVEIGMEVALLHGLVKVNRGAVEVHSRRESLFRCDE